MNSVNPELNRSFSGKGCLASGMACRQCCHGPRQLAATFADFSIHGVFVEVFVVVDSLCV